NMPAPGFLAELAKITRANKSLLILDEVQTGVGRTGTFFAYEQEGVKPDLVTLAKALGAGIPIGAMISNEVCADGFVPGSHGSTFAGNALACRAALTVLDVLDDDALLEHVTQTGAWLEDQIEQLIAKHDCLDGTRGRGFIRAIGFKEEWAPEAVQRALGRGLLLNKLNTRTLRLLPPLIAQRSHIRAALDILAEVLTDLAANPPK
ncbi:MAG: acetylornithine/N-succinyldiaminopimelate aminotransferase, partial [Myxococcota bacterium]